MATPSTSSSPPSLAGVGQLRLGVGPVRRSLFGPVDHLQLQQDFHRLLSVSLELANQRWSYDFHSDQPRVGADVEWEELSCQDVPAFYHSCLVKRGGRARKEGRAKGGEGGANGGEGGAKGGKSGEGRTMAAVGGARRMTQRLAREESSALTGSREEYLEVTTRGSYRLQRPEKRLARAKKRHQAAITDFFSVQKRKFLYPKRPASQ